MRMRTDRARQRVKEACLDGFLGMDLTSAPSAVHHARAVDACNLIAENGVLTARDCRWQSFPTLPGRINGVFPVTCEGAETLLVYAGTRFYLWAREAGWRELPVENVTGEVSGGMRDVRISGFFSGEYLYLVGAGLYLRFGKFGETWGVRTVEPYVPTVTVGISPVGTGDSLRTLLEPVNLLTPLRRNTLFGGESGSEWRLDGAVSPSHPVTVEAWVTRDGARVSRTFSTRAGEGTGTLYNAEGTAAGRVDYASGTLALAEETLGESSLPEVTVTFAGATGFFGESTSHGRRAIHASRMGTLFGVGGAGDRLFLSSEGERGEALYISARNDFTYFPDENVTVLGGSGEITALLPLSEEVLAVFRAARGCAPTVGYLTGEMREETGEDGRVGRTYPVFTVRAGATAESALHPFAVCDAAGEGLLLSRAGVYGISLLPNVSIDVRRLSERSYGIRRALAAADLSEAVLYYRAGRIYLSLGDGEGTCYVSDVSSRHTDAAFGGATYEWWRWSGVPARVFFEYGGELCFGTSDGRLCRMHRGERDVTLHRTRAGEIGFDYVRGKFVYGATLDGKIAEGEWLRFCTRGVTVRLLSGGSRIEGTRIYAPFGTAVYSRDAVYADGVAGSALTEGVPYYLVDCDPVTASFSLAATPDGTPVSLDGVDGEQLTLLWEITGEMLYVYAVNPTGRTFTLARDENSRTLPPASYLVSGADGEETAFLPLDPIADVIHLSPLTSYLVTPPLDFGEPTRWKTLLSVTVAGAGRLAVTAESATARGSRRVYLEGEEGQDVDFTAVSLARGRRACACLPLRLRRTGAITLRVDATGQCEVRGIAARARMEEEGRGVIG